VFEGEYDDYDGVSILFDPAAIAERYGARKEPFATSVYGDLPPLMAAGEATAFGTHHGSTFALRIVPGIAADGIDAGPIRTTGQLVLAGWHRFTYACAHAAGVLDEDEGATVSLPPGWYRVTVARAADPEDPEMFVSVTIGLEAIADPGPRPLPTEIPGSDGFF
jgi:hypothetical protein